MLGTISVKLTELMANATHTGCYELMDGRKAAGGLLELRFRHRTPLLVSLVMTVLIGTSQITKLGRYGEDSI